MTACLRATGDEILGIWDIQHLLPSSSVSDRNGDGELYRRRPNAKMSPSNTILNEQIMAKKVNPEHAEKEKAHPLERIHFGIRKPTDIVNVPILKVAQHGALEFQYPSSCPLMSVVWRPKVVHFGPSRR